MKKILLVAYYFPPVAASGALRPLGFCRYLGQYGWQPRVLTTDPQSVLPPHGVDTYLGSRVPGNVRVDVVPHGNPTRTLLSIRDKFREAVTLSPSGARAPEVMDGTPVAHGQGASRSRMGEWKALALDWLFAFPDPQCAWLRPAVKKLARLPAGDVPDVVFASGGPWTALLVGKTLAERFGVPFVADFRDPWTNNPYYRFSSPFLVNKSQRLERSICATAARVVTNTEALRREFCISYPELSSKFVTITNGFDREGWTDTLQPRQDREASAAACSAPTLELCHFGTIYGKRSPLELFEAIHYLVTQRKVSPQQLRLRFVGAWDIIDERCETLARALEKDGIVRREAPIPHENCLRQMREAQVLLILQPDSPLQIPGKIYEYIEAGRPLLVIGGQGATSHLVTTHQLGWCCPNQVPQIADTLLRLVTEPTCITPPQQANIDRFDYRILSGELANVFEAALRK